MWIFLGMCCAGILLYTIVNSLTDGELHSLVTDISWIKKLKKTFQKWRSQKHSIFVPKYNESDSDLYLTEEEEEFAEENIFRPAILVRDDEEIEDDVERRKLNPKRVRKKAHKRKKSRSLKIFPSMIDSFSVSGVVIDKCNDNHKDQKSSSLYLSEMSKGYYFIVRIDYTDAIDKKIMRIIQVPGEGYVEDWENIPLQTRCKVTYTPLTKEATYKPNSRLAVADYTVDDKSPKFTGYRYVDALVHLELLKTKDGSYDVVPQY